MTEQIRLYDDGIVLNGLLDLPENGQERFPLVVYLHGVTGCMEERQNTAICRAINRAGFGTLRLDLYGHGTSGGEFRDHTLWKWISNALNALNYSLQLPQVTGLWLAGHSQGGLTAMLTGDMMRDRISGLLLFSPAWMIPEAARRGDLLGIRFDPEHLPLDGAAGSDYPVGSNYIRVAQTIRVEEAVSGFRKPVLLLHGAADETVPVYWSDTLSKLYESCTYVRIPDETHCYDRHLDQVTDAVEAWLSGRSARI